MKLTNEQVISIPLTAGYEAIIDECDLPIVSAFRWRAKINGNTCYARTTSSRDSGSKTILLHRLIIGAGPTTIVDHIDRDGLNNRRSNLRIASVSLNNSNRQVTSKHGYRGLTFHPKCKTNPWQAQARFNGRKYNFGYYPTKEEAAKAHDKGLYELSGDTSILNFPEKFLALEQNEKEG